MFCVNHAAFCVACMLRSCGVVRCSMLNWQWKYSNKYPLTQMNSRAGMIHYLLYWYKSLYFSDDTIRIMIFHLVLRVMPCLVNAHIHCISIIRNSNFVQMTYRFVLSVVLLESLSYTGKPKWVQTLDFLIEGDSKETHGLLSAAIT